MAQQLKSMLSKVCTMNLTVAVCTPSRIHASHLHAALALHLTCVQREVTTDIPQILHSIPDALSGLQNQGVAYLTPTYPPDDN